MSKTNIEWTEHTWNPIVGCSIVSPGCTNCYAMKMAARIEAMGNQPRYAGTTRKVNGNHVWTGKLAQAPESTLLAPLRRKKPTTYFVNSMGDMFHEDCPDEWIDRVFAVMALAPQHTFQVLTKRAARMRDYCTGMKRPVEVLDRAMAIPPQRNADVSVFNATWPLPNVWLGVSAERQQEWDERKEYLRQTPAAVRFASFEPLLGSIVEKSPISDYLQWAIVGGESGSNARPMHPQWAEDLREQCDAAGVAFFFKQFGSWAPCDRINVSKRHALCGAMAAEPHIERDWARALDFLQKARGVGGAYVLVNVGKSYAGRLLNGLEYNGMPCPQHSEVLR